MIAGCAGWIAGLAMTLIGMNLSGPVGKWISVSGNILFFIGLALVGAAWAVRQKKAGQEAPKDSGTGGKDSETAGKGHQENSGENS